MDDSHSAFEDLLRVHASVIDGIVVLSVSGELDASTAPWLADEITRCIAGPLAGLIVDLSNVNFMASAGMSVLLEGDSTAKIVSKWFGVVANSRVTTRPIELLGLDQILNTYSTLDAARSDIATRT
ncbi:MAG: STAS domain-containing protein [Mycobacterium sp.]